MGCKHTTAESIGVKAAPSTSIHLPSRHTLSNSKRPTSTRAFQLTLPVT